MKTVGTASGGKAMYVPELIVGRLEAGCNGDVEEGGEEEMLEPSFDHHHLSGVELLFCHHKQLDPPT